VLHGLTAALLLRAAVATRAAAPAEILQEDWIESDQKAFAAWARPPEPADLSPKQFFEKLPALPATTGSATTPRELGYGVTTVYGTMPGGYCSLTAHLLVFDGVVAQARMQGLCKPAVWLRLSAFVGEKWPPSSRDVERGTHRGREYSWTNETRLAAVRRAMTADLGETEKAEAPAKLAGAFEELTSPFSSTHVSFAGGCYFSGTDPEGKTAIDSLVRAKRWDLVRMAARGLNPEGRVYAAHALRSAPADQRKPADAAVIDRIRALDLPIAVCAGCLIRRSTAAELLP